MKLLLEESIPDRGIEHLLNHNTLPLNIIILVSYRTRLDDLLPLAPKVARFVSERRYEFISGNTSLTKHASEGANLEFSVKWNHAAAVFLAHYYMAATLTRLLET